MFSFTHMRDDHWSISHVNNDISHGHSNSRRILFDRAPHKKTRLIALLFCRPELSLMKSDILPSLPYFHQRSGETPLSILQALKAGMTALQTTLLRKLFSRLRIRNSNGPPQRFAVSLQGRMATYRSPDQQENIGVFSHHHLIDSEKKWSETHAGDTPVDVTCSW
jgi:hypothetical protein